MKPKEKVIVIKVGSSVILDRNGSIKIRFVNNLFTQLVVLKSHKIFPVLVISGAVAHGRFLQKKKENSLLNKHILAGIGQAALISYMWKTSGKYGVDLAQMLLTREQVNFSTEIRNILLQYLQKHIVPILNENDVVSLNCFGGNDHLAGWIAQILNAEKLIILSHVAGLIDLSKSGRRLDKSYIVPNIHKFTPEILSMVSSETSKHGIGGMKTKIEIGRTLQKLNIPTIIANGNEKDVLLDLLIHQKKIGTHIISK